MDFISSRYQLSCRPGETYGIFGFEMLPSCLHSVSLGFIFVFIILSILRDISLAALGLGYSTQNLYCGVCEFLVVACGIWFPDQGLNPGPLALGGWSLSHWTTKEVPLYPLTWSLGKRGGESGPVMEKVLMEGALDPVALRGLSHIVVKPLKKRHYFPWSFTAHFCLARNLVIAG